MFDGVISMFKAHPWSMSFTAAAILIGGGLALFLGIRDTIRKRKTK